MTSADRFQARSASSGVVAVVVFYVGAGLIGAVAQGHYFGIALGCVLLGLIARACWRRRARWMGLLAADAERQHAALLNGDTRTGVYGRFQPAVDVESPAVPNEPERQ